MELLSKEKFLNLVSKHQKFLNREIFPGLLNLDDYSYISDENFVKLNLSTSKLKMFRMLNVSFF